MARPVKHARRVAVPVGLLLLTATASIATAQTQTNVAVPGRGAGAFNVTFQHITMTERELIVVREDFGEVSSRAAYFELDYGLTVRLALAVTLPLKSIRYVGDQPHDPTLLANDHGEVLLDDGNYHTNWGDIGFNFRWLWRSTDRFAITPFAGYYTPSNDYPLFTETQAGRRQWRWDVGINAAGRLGPPVVEAEPVDRRAVLRQAEDARARVARLGARGEGADLDESEAEAEQRAGHFGVLVETCCQTDRRRKREP